MYNMNNNNITILKASMNNFNHVKMKKANRIIQQTADIYLKGKQRSPQHTAIRKYDAEPLRLRKSIEVSLTQPNRPQQSSTINNPIAKPIYKRVTHNFRKQVALKRYDQQDYDRERVPDRQFVNFSVNREREKDKERSRDQRPRDVSRSSKSPYIKQTQSSFQKDMPGRTSALNKSSQKIRSNQLIKQSPYNFYRQPRSSLSQHYDPSIEASLHKRRVSLVADEKQYMLEQAKQAYKNNNYSRSIDLLRKFVKTHKQCTQGRYLLGMSLININDFANGIQQLLHCLQLDANYKKSLYLVIALAYKRILKYDQAIAILDKGLLLFPDYYDCLVYRGKLYLKQEKYSLALRDFSDAINLNKSKGFAYIGKGTCEKELGETTQAIKSFSAGIGSDMTNICYQKRGILYYEQNNIELALRDFECITHVQNYNSSTAHYYRGMCYYREGKEMDAMLCFEQALKHDNHRDNVTLAVQAMIRIKIDEKDFYQAYHILNRAENVDVNKDVINEWRLFLEASLFLMKKKYKDGVDTFKSLLTLPLFKQKFSQIKSNAGRERYAFLKPLIHLYKAFGQLSENKPDNAEKEYQMHSQLCRQLNIADDNLSKRYNLLIMHAYQQFPTNSLRYVEEASQLIPTKPEPYLYIAFDKVQNKLEKEENPTAKVDILDQIIECISIGITHLPQLSNNHISTFYFYRAVLYLYKNEFNKAVSDVDKAIEKSEDNIPKYFYLRGLIFACFGNFAQAVQDLSVAINLDDKYSKPYLQRAKCLQIEGSSNEAFLDLQKYITLAPQDQNIHKYAGYLLFQNCAYEDCLSAFSHGADLLNDYELILTKAKCHFLLGDYQTALPLFKKYADQSYHTDFNSDVDIIEICRSIKKDSKRDYLMSHVAKLDEILNQKVDEDCKIFKFRDMHQIKGSIYLILGEYEEAIRSFQKTLELFIVEKNKELEKHFIEDSEQFEDEWSQVQIKFNISLCYLCLHEYKVAKELLLSFEKCSEKGRNWSSYMQLIDDLIDGNLELKKGEIIELDTFEQNHRISKFWPKIKMIDEKGHEINLSLAFSYPFVEPPELMPEFDEELFLDFTMSKSENKPEAPWINRCDKGLVFTPNVQVYQNLQLSMTTTKKNEESEKNKPASQMENSIDMSNSEYQLETVQLKKKFKLDSLVEMKLNKLIRKQ